MKVRDQAEETYKHAWAYFCLILSFLPCDVRQLTIVLDLGHRCHQYLANWLCFTYYNTILHGSDIKARQTLSFVGKVGLRPHRCRDRGIQTRAGRMSMWLLHGGFWAAGTLGSFLPCVRQPCAMRSVPGSGYQMLIAPAAPSSPKPSTHC